MVAKLGSLTSVQVYMILHYKMILHHILHIHIT